MSDPDSYREAHQSQMNIFHADSADLIADSSYFLKS
jgi:hypothetical protein